MKGISNKALKRYERLETLYKIYLDDREFYRLLESLNAESWQVVMMFFQQLLQNFILFVQKQLDYGSGNIARFGELGVMVRANDKIERLRTLLLENREAKNEPIEDTWRDLANYGVIGLLCHLGLWPEYKPPEPIYHRDSMAFEEIYTEGWQAGHHEALQNEPINQECIKKQPRKDKDLLTESEIWCEGYLDGYKEAQISRETSTEYQDPNPPASP